VDEPQKKEDYEQKKRDVHHPRRTLAGAVTERGKG
jgi:hypothetical protein